MKIGVIGINHTVAGVSLREKLASTCLKELFFSPKAVLLTTCNRTEIYYSCEDLAERHSQLLNLLCQSAALTYRSKFYSYFGRDCFCHLARVTAGLDSAILGETEIQGQVKIAYERAARLQRLPPELHYLFQKSLSIGKTVRTQLRFDGDPPRLAESVLEAGKHLGGPNILFVGASEINAKIWSLFHERNRGNLTLCNRSQNKITKSFPGSFIPWNRLSDWAKYDWVIFATGAPFHLIDKVPPGAQTRLIIDLSVPRNVDAKIGSWISLLNVDQIQRSLRRPNTPALYTLAEKRVSEKASRYSEHFKNKTRRSGVQLVDAERTA